MKKRVLSTLLALCMVLALLPERALAADIVNSGTCGDNLVWTLDRSGVLTISGSGEMDNYFILEIKERPWHSERANIKHVEIGSGVTNIGASAFCDCSNLININIPDSVTSIGVYAFYRCNSLTSVAIPGSVTHIGETAFSECSRLSAFIVSESNVNYAAVEGVLFDKSKSTLICCPGGINGSYTIPDHVTSLAGSAFHGCQNLTSVTIPNGITDIKGSTFLGCDSLTNIIIPNGVTHIGIGAFNYCNNLTSITIPFSVTSIGALAFSHCESLSDVYYGGSEAQWNEIKNGGANDGLTSATIHYSNDSTPNSDPSPSPNSSPSYPVITPEQPVENEQPTTSPEFTDVADTTWYHDAVTYVNKPVSPGYNYGLMDSSTATEFAPNAKADRGTIVTALCRRFNFDLEAQYEWADNIFSDVPKEMRAVVSWAVSNGIVAGYGNGKFGPSDPVTREQFAVMLYRYCQYKSGWRDTSLRADLSSYSDSSQISSWAIDAMSWANASGYITGTTTTTLSPKNNITRAEVATIFMRLA